MKQTSVRRLSLFGSLLAGVMLFANAANAQCDNLYPIAISATTLQNVAPGAEINDILNGSQPGNFGWLTWAGAPNEPTVLASLAVPGNSYTYVDPFDPFNHSINAGSWIEGKPGLSNSKSVRDALHKLEGLVITVPVWDTSTAQGNNTLYHIIGFAQVQITGYYLPNQNRISVFFIGYTSCFVNT